MVFNLLVVLFFPLLILIPDIPFNPPKKDLSISFETIGPFDEYCPNPEFKVTFSSQIVEIGVCERILCGPSKDDLQSIITKPTHSIYPKETWDVIFNLPTSLYLSKDGMYVSIQLYSNKESNVLCESFFNLYPSTYENINPKNYMQNSYISYNRVISNSPLISIKNFESFFFNDFIDYINVDSYYRLDLSFLSIAYLNTYEWTLTGEESYLTFYDVNNLFPYITKSEINKIRIPLKIIENNGKLQFIYQKEMFVMPSTLEMSLEPKVGFVTTKYFYLPINKMKSFLGESFALEVKNLGANKISFNWFMSFLTDRLLIGDCQNSDYCVVGELGNE